jgi:hypothetical protein
VGEPELAVAQATAPFTGRPEDDRDLVRVAEDLERSAVPIAAGLAALALAFFSRRESNNKPAEKAGENKGVRP